MPVQFSLVIALYAS